MSAFLRQHWLAISLILIVLILLFGPVVYMLGGSVSGSGVHQP